MIRYIRTTLGLTQFSEEDIDTVLGIFLVNDFEINAHINDEEFSSAGGNACEESVSEGTSVFSARAGSRAARTSSAEALGQMEIRISTTNRTNHSNRFQY